MFSRTTRNFKLETRNYLLRLHFINGPLVMLVTSAIITSMVNNNGEITPKLSPILRTISSVNPRVFISHPNATASG